MGIQTVLLDPADLRRWYVDEGLSLRQIGALTGVPYKSVQRHLIWAGIERRPSGPWAQPGWTPLNGGGFHRITEAEAAEIRAAFAADPNLPVKDAVQKFGRTAPTIRKLTRDLRVTTQDRVERLVELHAQGLRGHQIDRAIGWYPGNASYHQRRLGLDPHPPPVTLPEPGELRRLYDEAWDIQTLAQRLGVTRRQAKEALRAAGAGRHFGAKKAESPLEPHADEIRRAYVDGKIEIRDLAARYGVKAGTMRHFLQDRGIARTPRLTAADHERIVALAAEGLTKVEIARRMNCSAPAVARHLRIGAPQRVSKTAQPRAA